MITRLQFFRHGVLAAFLLAVTAVAGYGQPSGQILRPNTGPTLGYKVEMMGTAVHDTVIPFPVPIAFLRLTDTNKYNVSVRFPRLGMLGIVEDTVYAPSFSVGDTLSAYRAEDPMLQIAYPKMMYGFFVDTKDKATGKLLESKGVSYEMTTQQYRPAKVEYLHQPITAIGNLNLRQAFRPELIPLTLEAHPGWLGREELDSTDVYSLTFRDPDHPDVIFLSLTIRPTAPTRFDSTSWNMFKERAKVAFGEKGVGVKELGDFVMDDAPTRHLIKAGYEFVAKQNGNMEYVASYLTPRAIFLLMAPLSEDADQARLEYFRAIARSFKVY